MDVHFHGQDGAGVLAQLAETISKKRLWLLLPEPDYWVGISVRSSDRYSL